MSKSAKEILQEARALVAKGWTKGTYARDAKGEIANVYSDDATCFCMIGAFHRAEGPTAPGTFQFSPGGDEAIRALHRAVAADEIAGWSTSANDAAETVDVVLGYFDAAIALLPLEASSSS